VLESCLERPMATPCMQVELGRLCLYYQQYQGCKSNSNFSDLKPEKDLSPLRRLSILFPKALLPSLPGRPGHPKAGAPGLASASTPRLLTPDLVKPCHCLKLPGRPCSTVLSECFPLLTAHWRRTQTLIECCIRGLHEASASAYCRFGQPFRNNVFASPRKYAAKHFGALTRI
jgi:hypothetical protein